MQDLKPLLPEVRIVCPASTAYVHPHVVLVDAPGVQDANAARGNVVKKLLEDENFFFQLPRVHSHSSSEWFSFKVGSDRK